MKTTLSLCMVLLCFASCMAMEQDKRTALQGKTMPEIEREVRAMFDGPVPEDNNREIRQPTIEVRNDKIEKSAETAPTKFKKYKQPHQIMHK